jgi:hypothetical protein
MRNKSLRLSLRAVSRLQVSSGTALAPHGSAAHAMSKTVTVTGTITDLVKGVR